MPVILPEEHYTFRGKTILFGVPVRSGSLDVSSDRSAAMTAAGFVATGVSAQPPARSPV
jgi:hypothetical protein